MTRTVGGAPVSLVLARLLQAVLVGMFAVGVLTANVALVVNAALAGAVTLVPVVLRRDFRVTLGPGLTLAVTAAAVLHVVGMAGPYETIWWWDHLTHALSATMVAAAGYVVVRAVDENSDAIRLPQPFLSVVVLVVTLAAGVLWEVAEFAARFVGEAVGAEPILVQYSIDDTLLDLVFDAVGAVVVAVFGGSKLSGLTDRVADALRSARE
ncbi:hypothetical protein [Halobaculum sp. P14]|uniref:hypothetical protein n=1 Tax=Halobaculum sp. P14 TaxID=3421638 RepID=UPI003EB8D4FF